jgi:hypothetical protein
MTQETTNQTQDVVTSALESLVGPGKKYADQEALAQSRLKADAFIGTLTVENRELRTLANQQDARLQKLESQLAILSGTNSNDSPVTPVNQTSTQKTGVSAEPQRSSLTEEDVLKVVERSKREEAQNRNKAEVDAVLIKQFGAEASNVLAQKAAEFGMSKEALYQIAVTSPNAFYQMIGTNPKAQVSNTTYVPRGSVTPINNSEPIRNNAYYEAKKREMGVLKFINDRSLQLQRHKDMERLGDAWEA